MVCAFVLAMSKGPFHLGAFSKPVAVLAIVGALVLAWVGMQPPNEKVFYVGVGLVVVMLVFWFAAERRRFEGPPTSSATLSQPSAISSALCACSSGKHISTIFL
jgi:hypothetical protein